MFRFRQMQLRNEIQKTEFEKIAGYDLLIAELEKQQSVKDSETEKQQLDNIVREMESRNIGKYKNFKDCFCLRSSCVHF